MKLTPCALLLGLAFTCGSSAQETPPPADPALHEQLAGLGYGEAVASSATYYSGTRPEGMSYGYHFRGYEGHGPSPAGVTEIQVIRFTEQEGADAFMLAKAPILGDYMGEQRGRYVVLVAGDTIENPERSLEILREVWSAVARADDTHSIPPTRMRKSRVGEDVAVSSDRDDPAFRALFDRAAGSTSDRVSAEQQGDVREIVIGGEGMRTYAQATRLGDADRSVLRSRGDEGNGGRTRGLNLGGGAKKATVGLVGGLGGGND